MLSIIHVIITTIIGNEVKWERFAINYLTFVHPTTQPCLTLF